MRITDDPVADHDRYQREREREFAHLPRCCECDEQVQDDYYVFGDEVYCDECARGHKRFI